MISQERPQFQEMVRQANHVLKSVSKKAYYRDFYFDVKNEMVCEAPFPKWIDKDLYPKNADMLSKPMKYHDLEMKMQLLAKNPPKAKKKEGHRKQDQRMKHREREGSKFTNAKILDAIKGSIERIGMNAELV